MWPQTNPIGGRVTRFFKLFSHDHVGVQLQVSDLNFL